MADETTHETKARIGMVNYINTAPIYEIWKRTVTDDRYLLIEEPPSVLNRMLATGEIDLGFVSSYEYCMRPEKYRILQDLSISATGPVGSVFLFSQIPLEQLNHRLVLLSNQSETSASLVKIILEQFHQIQPQYIQGEIGGEISKSCQAILAIGDDALRLVTSGVYAYQFDLGEIWNKLTNLPFVFSVCAVREEFCRQNADLVRRIQQSLITCREQGQEDLLNICRLVAPRIPMDTEKCYSYLRALQYDLSAVKCQALERFFGFLIARGEASEQSLPLKFFPTN